MTQEYRFKNSCVADLVWAVASPPLLNTTVNGCNWFSNDWYQQLPDELIDELHRLDLRRVLPHPVLHGSLRLNSTLGEVTQFSTMPGTGQLKKTGWI